MRRSGGGGHHLRHDIGNHPGRRLGGTDGLADIGSPTRRGLTTPNDASRCGGGDGSNRSRCGWRSCCVGVCWWSDRRDAAGGEPCLARALSRSVSRGICVHWCTRWVRPRSRCSGSAPRQPNPAARDTYSTRASGRTTAGLTVSCRCGSYTASRRPSLSCSAHGPSPSTPNSCRSSTFPTATAAATS